MFLFNKFTKTNSFNFLQMEKTKFEIVVIYRRPLEKAVQNGNAMEWCGCFKNNNKPKSQYAAEVYFGGCDDGSCVFIIITRCNSASLVVYIY